MANVDDGRSVVKTLVLARYDPAMAADPPKERMVAGASRLFARQGYGATTMRGVVEEADAPWGSVHHYFPGGKQQLGVAAIEHGSAGIGGLVEHCLAATQTPGDAVRAYFAAVVTMLEASGFADGCPVGTVALELAATPGPVASSCGAAFDAWRAQWAAAFAGAGITPERAADLAALVVVNVEGALVLARVGRSTRTVRLAGDTVAALVDAAA